MSDTASQETRVRRILASFRAHWRSLLAYCLAFFGSVAGPVWVHRLRPADLSYPWRVKDSDLSSVYSLAQALGQSWTGLVHHSLGAPFNANLALAFIPDDLHLEIMRVLVHITHNPFTAVNLFYVLTYGLCGISFLYLCDKMECNRHIGIPMALAYSWLPYHFTRMNDGHVFLAAYYMIPIGVLVLINLVNWLSDRSENFVPENRVRRTVAGFAVVAVGSSGAYYGLFFALLTSATVFLIPQRGKSFKDTFRRTLTVGTVAVGFVIAPILRNIWARTHGLDMQLKRNPLESVQFGGSLSRLFVPWGVWLPDRLQPIVERQEFEWLAVPILAVIGVWLLTIGILRGLVRSKDHGANNRVQPLQFVFFWAILFFTAGGLSLVFAYGVDPSFRTWNRVAIIIMTIALLAMAIALNSFLRSTSQRRLALVGVIALSVTTQLWPIERSGISREPDVVSLEQIHQLQRVASRIQKIVPRGCSILQLPIMAFPEGGVVDEVGNGEHLWLPLLTRGFRWSYGAPKGSEHGRFWLSRTVDQSVTLSRNLGFCAVVAIGPNRVKVGPFIHGDSLPLTDSVTLFLFTAHDRP